MGIETQQIGNASDMQLVNEDQVNKFRDYLNTGIATAQTQGDQYASSATSALEKILANSGNYDNLIKMLTSGSTGLEAQIGAVKDAANSYDPQAGLNAFISKNPELQALAAQIADGAFSPTRESAQALASRVSRDALSDTASKMSASGLLGSGAALATMTDASMRPQLEMEQNLAQSRAGLYGNIMGSYGNTALTGLNSGYDAQAARALQAAISSGELTQSGIGTMANIYGGQDAGLSGVAAGYGSLAGTEANKYAALLAALSQQNEPVYWNPQYYTRDWAQIGVQGLATLAALT